MTSRKGLLWYIVNGTMEMSWFFAWAMFSAMATMHRPFPFLEAIGVFALAACLTRISMGKGWRIAQILALQVFGFLGSALAIIHLLYCSSQPLLSPGWLTGFFSASKSPSEWLILLVNLFWILLLWAGGVTLARRPKAYYVTCARFDFGLAAFFALFVTKLIILTKGGMRIDDPLSLLFVFPFFLFSLLSIGMVRIQSDAPKSFLPGYQGIGIIVSFVAVVLLGAGGLVAFLLPGLTVAAEMGYRVLKVAGAPLGSVFVSIVRFMFMPRGSRPDAPAEPSRGIDWEAIKPGTHGWWMELLEKILGWGLSGLVLLAVAVMAGISVFYLLKWLFSRTSVGEKRERQDRSISSWFVRPWGFLISSCKKMSHSMKGYEKAAELYGALLGWARRSGFSDVRSETPLELGARLDARFPALKPQIEVIISAFNQEVYGETVLSGMQLATARSAWRTLRSPLRWPSRLKTWFLKPSTTTISNI
jgi:hypothetical protein